MRFENKVVIITGAASGIGEATAIDFAKEGARLVIADRDEAGLSDTAQKCKHAGARKVVEFIGDLAHFSNVELLINKAVKEYERIDILVNNAGLGYPKAIAEVELEMYQKIFDTNLRAPVFLSKYALPYLKKSKGCIVNVSSCASLMAVPNIITYSMTKAALDHFTRGFSAECAPFGVRVNCINPAVVHPTRYAENCGLGEEETKNTMAGLCNSQPLGVIDPHHVSQGIRFLCTSEMITGIALPVDGGLLHTRKRK